MKNYTSQTGKHRATSFLLFIEETPSCGAFCFPSSPGQVYSSQTCFWTRASFHLERDWSNF
jgi:hypothetical protein